VGHLKVRRFSEKPSCACFNFLTTVADNLLLLAQPKLIRSTFGFVFEVPKPVEKVASEWDDVLNVI